MRIRHLAAVAAAALTLAPLAPLATPARASVMPAPTALVGGADVGWPNCPTGMGIPTRRTLGLPMPTRSARFVVVGVTNGPAFTPNPCLRSQVGWVRQRHLWLSAYSVVSYPSAAQLRRYGGSGTLSTKLRRVGVAQARYTLATLRRAGVARPRMVWVDVETVRGFPWSASAARNKALLGGVLAGYRAAGVRTGIYSYSYAWKKITGGMRSTLPTWVPSGSDTRAKALARCSQRSFSGGRVLMGQWSDGMRDDDVTCPGVARQLRSFFAAT